MKNIIKTIGLITLIGFSFFYTDKVIEVIKEEDQIMIELEERKDIYKIDPIDATIVDNTIIPGLNGQTVNVDSSYKNMKKTGIFNNKLIIYDIISPQRTIRMNKDKFIIMGNNNKQMVSFLFQLKDNKYLKELEEILNKKDVIANYFIDYNYLIENTTKIKEMTNREFYSDGNNGEYSPDNLLFSNNLISRISNNDAIYCLSSNMDKNTLELCSKNDLYTIVPSIICKDNPYLTIKEKLNSGSMILFQINPETIKELGTIIDYIRGKGLKIAGLSQLLSEELNNQIE